MPAIFMLQLILMVVRTSRWPIARTHHTFFYICIQLEMHSLSCVTPKSLKQKNRRLLRAIYQPLVVRHTLHLWRILIVFQFSFSFIY